MSPQTVFTARQRTAGLKRPIRLRLLTLCLCVGLAACNGDVLPTVEVPMTKAPPPVGATPAPGAAPAPAPPPVPAPPPAPTPPSIELTVADEAPAGLLPGSLKSTARETAAVSGPIYRQPIGTANDRLLAVHRWEGQYQVVVREISGSLAVWRSQDGRTWARSVAAFPSLASTVTINQVVGLANGLLARTTDNQFFFSTDGGLGWAALTATSVGGQTYSFTVPPPSSCPASACLSIGAQWIAEPQGQAYFVFRTAAGRLVVLRTRDGVNWGASAVLPAQCSGTTGAAVSGRLALTQQAGVPISIGGVAQPAPALVCASADGGQTFTANIPAFTDPPASPAEVDTRLGALFSLGGRIYGATLGAVLTSSSGAVAYTSDDARTWRPGLRPGGSPDGACVDLGLPDVLHAQQRLISTCFDPLPNPDGPTLRTSSDGFQWTRLDRRERQWRLAARAATLDVDNSRDFLTVWQTVDAATAATNTLAIVRYRLP